MFILSLIYLSSVEGTSEGGLSASFDLCHLVHLGANLLSLCHFLFFKAFKITLSLYNSCDTYNDKMKLTHKKLRNIFDFTDFSPFLWLSSGIMSPTELIIITTPQALGEAQKRWSVLVIKNIF